MFSFETNTWGSSKTLSEVSSRSPTTEYRRSKLVEQNVANLAAQAALLKSAFHEVDMMPVGSASGHTHPESAAARSTASRLIDEIGKAVGRRVVYHQGSAADLRNGRHVNRTYHWAKDVYVPAVDVSYRASDIVAMVDVDYYVDMREFLARNTLPVLMYTFTPSAAAADRGEYKYTFNHDGVVDYMVSGGGRFQHHLWDWGGDALAVTEYRMFGLVKCGYHTYAIERREIDADHSLVLLAPLSSETGYRSWGLNQVLAAAELKRFQPVCGRFVRFDVNKPDGLWRTTAVCGQYLAANVRATEDDAVSNVNAARTTRLTLATVKGICKDREGAEVLWAYHLDAGGAPLARVDVASGVRRFQWVARDGTFDEEAKPALKAFMAPIVDGAFAPDKCRGNDERSVDHRVEKLKGFEPVLTYKLSKIMDEFVALMIPSAQRLHPVDIDEVYRRQPRPTQRRILEDAEFEDEEGKARSMQKSEAYGKVTDPRMITTIHGRSKRDYARYTYAFHDGVMVYQPWYAFSKTPREIAERVAEICRSSQSHVHMKDFSRMDGRVTAIVRELNRRLYLRAFHPDHAVEMYSAMRRNYNLHAVTTYGVKYETAWAQCSGACDTSDSNTGANAFCAYTGYRLAGLDPDDAWDALGIYAGDDGLDADASEKAMVMAARMVGQKLEVERVRKGDTYVHFLARYYGPEVWDGAPDSVCDIRRQLAKFHTTVYLPSNVLPAHKLVDKTFAFSLTDANTPVFENLIAKVKNLYPDLWPTESTWTNVTRQWLPELGLDKQYPNHCGDWGTDLLEEQLPEFDVRRFSEQLVLADRDTIFTMGLCMEPEPVSPPTDGLVLVDGDLIGDSAPPIEPRPTVVAVSPDPQQPVIEAQKKPRRTSRSRPRKPKCERGRAPWAGPRGKQSPTPRNVAH